MKNLIYQVWCGTLTEEAKVSSKLMKQYADRIGVEYLLHTNPNIASKRVNSDGPYWEWLNPTIDDSFLEYDNVLVLDLDIFPVKKIFLIKILEMSVHVQNHFKENKDRPLL